MGIVGGAMDGIDRLVPQSGELRSRRVDGVEGAAVERIWKVRLQVP